MRPPDAEAVLDDKGNVLGFISLRQFAPGRPYAGGWDVWKGAQGRPYTCVQTKGDAIQTLRGLRHRPDNDEFNPRVC
jgi:hypothetical protein